MTWSLTCWTALQADLILPAGFEKGRLTIFFIAKNSEKE
jgi:hypothetical protein